jgi:hypothetical protein
MFGNKVIFASNGSTYHDCSWTGPLAFNNTLFGTPLVKGKGCPTNGLTLGAWQALSPSNDVGSTVNATIPLPGEIIAWGRAKLGL